MFFKKNSNPGFQDQRKKEKPRPRFPRSRLSKAAESTVPPSPHTHMTPHTTSEFNSKSALVGLGYRSTEAINEINTAVANIDNLDKLTVEILLREVFRKNRKQ